MNIGYKQQRKYFMIISIANFRRRMRFLNRGRQITRGKMIEQLTIFVKFSAKAICHTLSSIGAVLAQLLKVCSI